MVVPVHNGSAVLGACLDSVVPQAVDSGAEVVVVDDGSDDGTFELAAARGARVLRTDMSRGPYAARNTGWHSTPAPIVVFTDARCRARPGWLKAIVAPLGDDEAAVAGADVVMGPGRTLAERWAARDQRLRIAQHMAHEFLPFVPTASLGVRRRTLEKLGGFREVRSGGDVDLCWRVQLQGLGPVVAAPGAVMDYEPRSSVRAVLRQWRRYGEAHAHLWTEFAPYGCPVPQPDGRWRAVRHGTRWAARALVRRRDPVEFVDSVRYAVYQLAYASGLTAARRGAPWE